jgi:hypothetical protein
MACGIHYAQHLVRDFGPCWVHRQGFRLSPIVSGTITSRKTLVALPSLRAVLAVSGRIQTHVCCLQLLVVLSVYEEIVPSVVLQDQSAGSHFGYLAAAARVLS